MYVKPDERAPRTARMRLNGLKSDLGDRFNDVALVVSELVSNSVRHADGVEDIGVAVDTRDHVVRIEVTDSGPCFDVSDPRGDGMGLDIVGQLAEKWGVRRDDGCTAWAEILV